MPVSIKGGFAFYGYIPDGSKKQHLGIVLGVSDELLKYCYCTSKYSKITRGIDHIKIPAEKMKAYFAEPRDTYIFISMQHIITMYLITFRSRIGSEYDIKPEIGNDIYISILSRIRNSDNLSERFKNEFFDFLE